MVIALPPVHSSSLLQALAVGESKLTSNPDLVNILYKALVIEDLPELCTIIPFALKL